jgi:LPXTG-motif cell wall-anchored protein
VTDTDNSHYFGQEVQASATIGDTVWSDENENGVQDNGEKGIAGATVRLTLPDATTVQTNTNANGLYLFSALDAGEYKVELIVSSIPEPSDGSNTLTTPGSFTIQLVDGQSYLDADFGIAAGLPATGIASDQIVLIALALLLLGGLALLAVSRRKGDRGEGDIAA